MSPVNIIPVSVPYRVGSVRRSVNLFQLLHLSALIIITSCVIHSCSILTVLLLAIRLGANWWHSNGIRTSTTSIIVVIIIIVEHLSSSLHQDLLLLCLVPSWAIALVDLRQVDVLFIIIAFTFIPHFVVIIVGILIFGHCISCRVG